MCRETQRGEPAESDACRVTGRDCLELLEPSERPFGVETNARVGERDDFFFPPVRLADKVPTMLLLSQLTANVSFFDSREHPKEIPGVAFR